MIRISVDIEGEREKQFLALLKKEGFAIAGELDKVELFSRYVIYIGLNEIDKVQKQKDALKQRIEEKRKAVENA